MPRVLWLLIGIVVLAIIVYLVVGLVYGKATIQDTAPKIIPINTPKVVYDSDSVKNNLLSHGGSTVMAFVNVRFGDRTTKIGNEFISVLGVKDSFSFDITPESAQLTVMTQAGTSLEEEIIPIPKLPLQKWICVSILRDGRRFDILYDDQIVASHRLQYFPRVVLNPLIIGNTSLLGNGIHVLVAPYRLTPTDVAKQRAKLVDMNGRPVKAGTAFGLPPIPSMELVCLPGLPCNQISKPPTDRLKSWYTPYS